MKKIIACLSILMCLAFVATAQTDYAGYLANKDTITAPGNATHEVTITGAKSALSFQVNVLKISGTVAGSITIYGSVDGTNYETAALDSVALQDASQNYVFKHTSNNYLKYRITVTTTGTSSISERSYVLYRK
jgi:hypothetical protein